MVEVNCRLLVGNYSELWISSVVDKDNKSLFLLKF